MNNFIKQVIEEKFESKKQQRLFWAKSNDKSLSPKERKKWKKWAQEFSDKTDFDKLPEKKEDVDEMVDSNGNIIRGNKTKSFATKGTTSNSITDKIVKTGAGSMGIHGVHGTHTSLRYWAESDMSKSLGYDKTMGVDADYDDAEKHFKKDLGLNDDETELRMGNMGYDEDLPGDKVRLVENPKKFVEEYLESIISKKTDSKDFVKKDQSEEFEKDVNPIIKKQIKSLKDSLKSNNLSVDDVMKHLKDDE